MKARIKWIEDRSFLCQTDSGHGIVVGASKRAAAPARDGVPWPGRQGA